VKRKRKEKGKLYREEGYPQGRQRSVKKTAALSSKRKKRKKDPRRIRGNKHDPRANKKRREGRE